MTAQSKPPSVQDSPPAWLTAARSESRVRSQLVGVRLSPAEYADVQRICAAHSLTPGALLRAGLVLIQMTETP